MNRYILSKLSGLLKISGDVVTGIFVLSSDEEEYLKKFFNAVIFDFSSDQKQVTINRNLLANILSA